MQQLVQIEVRCPRHERVDAGCAGCKLAAQFQQESDTLRSRRAAFLDRVKAAVRDKVVAIVEFR